MEYCSSYVYAKSLEIYVRKFCIRSEYEINFILSFGAVVYA